MRVVNPMSLCIGPAYVTPDTPGIGEISPMHKSHVAPRFATENVWVNALFAYVLKLQLPRRVGVFK